MCWIDHTGKLVHYVPVSDGSIKDGSVSNKHVEFAHTYHAFICIRQTKDMASFLSDVTDKVGDSGGACYLPYCIVTK